MIDHIDIGGSLDAGDYSSAATLDDFATFSSSANAVYKQVDVTARVAADIAGLKSDCDFRLHHVVATAGLDGEHVHLERRGARTPTAPSRSCRRLRTALDARMGVSSCSPWPSRWARRARERSRRCRRAGGGARGAPDDGGRRRRRAPCAPSRRRRRGEWLSVSPAEAAKHDEAWRRAHPGDPAPADGGGVGGGGLAHPPALTRHPALPHLAAAEAALRRGDEAAARSAWGRRARADGAGDGAARDRASARRRARSRAVTR